MIVREAFVLSKGIRAGTSVRGSGPVQVYFDGCGKSRGEMVGWLVSSVIATGTQ